MAKRFFGKVDKKTKMTFVDMKGKVGDTEYTLTFNEDRKDFTLRKAGELVIRDVLLRGCMNRAEKHGVKWDEVNKAKWEVVK